MAREWQLQEAKAHFSELVRRARAGEPQVVTKHGEPAVVVIDHDQYRRLRGPQPRLIDVLLAAPRIAADDMPIERDPSPARHQDLP
jgi:prevent-host-death family protein